MSSYLISTHILEQNKKLHEKGFGGGGHKWSDRINGLIQQYRISSVLDFGSGQGTLGPELKNCSVTEYDPAIEGKDTLPNGVYGLCVCTDVLEHVEPELLDNVLSCIANRCQMAFFSIATRPSNKHFEDGTNCHLIIANENFWRARLEEYFTDVESQMPMRDGEVVFLCKK